MHCHSWFLLYALAYAPTHPHAQTGAASPPFYGWGRGNEWKRSEAELHVVGWSTFMSNNPSLRLHLLCVWGWTGWQSFRHQQHEHRPPPKPRLSASLLLASPNPCLVFILSRRTSSYSLTPLYPPPVLKLWPEPFSSPLSCHLPSPSLVTRGLPQ